MGSPGQGRSGRFDGVDRIRLALASAGLAVLAVDFDHLDTRSGQEAGEACSIGTGPFHADQSDTPEPGEPRQQCRIAVGSGIEGLGPEQSAHLVEGGSNVNLTVGIDTPCDRTRSFYDGHWHPFLP